MNVLVTTSNRGLGLELVKQYAQDGWQVLATCRHPAQIGRFVRFDGTEMPW